MFQRGNRRFPADRRKIGEEVVQGLPLLEVIQERLKGNASLPENWNTSEDVRVPNDGIFHIYPRFSLSLQPMPAGKKGHSETAFCNRK